MKESVGYTVTLNIVITFIVIVFAFLSGVLMYYKSYKVSNMVIYSLEKYEGYNELSSAEISAKLTSIGYNLTKTKCENSVNDAAALDGVCKIQNDSVSGTCIYLCTDKDDTNYYYYKASTNMVFNIPIINDLINIPIYSNTNRMYNYTENIDALGKICVSYGYVWDGGSCKKEDGTIYPFGYLCQEAGGRNKQGNCIFD